MLEEKVKKVAYNQKKCDKVELLGEMYFCKEPEKKFSCKRAFISNKNYYCYPVKEEKNGGRS